MTSGWRRCAACALAMKDFMRIVAPGPQLRSTPVPSSGEPEFHRSYKCLCASAAHFPRWSKISRDGWRARALLLCSAACDESRIVSNDDHVATVEKTSSRKIPLACERGGDILRQYRST